MLVLPNGFCCPRDLCQGGGRGAAPSQTPAMCFCSALVLTHDGCCVLVCLWMIFPCSLLSFSCALSWRQNARSLPTKVSPNPFGFLRLSPCVRRFLSSRFVLEMPSVVCSCWRAAFLSPLPLPFAAQRHFGLCWGAICTDWSLPEWAFLVGHSPVWFSVCFGDKKKK
eukprot:RCo000529